MIKKSTSLTLLLTIDAILILICIVGIYHISEKSTLPFTLDQRNDGLYVSELTNEDADVSINDRLLKVLYYPVENIEEVECVLDGIKINKIVGLTLQNEDGVYQIELHTIPFYSFQYLLIASFVSLCFFVIGIFVLVNKPKLKSAKLFHAGSISTGIIIATTWGNYNIEPLGLGILIRLMFSGAYSFAPLFFISFVLSLRERKRKIYKYIKPLLYIVSLGFFLLQSASFLYFLNKETILSMQIYLKAFSGFRMYLLCYIVTGFSIFIYTYNTAVEEYELKKLRWILFGFSVGLFGLIVFWLLPYLIVSKGLIPEELLLLMMLFIPVTFAISIVRYRLLDIDWIIERSIVYGLVIIILLIPYIFIITFITSILNIDNKTFPAIITATLVAVFFQPISSRIQTFVNKKFFRIQYNFRDALKSFIDNIQHDNEIVSISKKIVDNIDKIIPVERIGIFIVDPSGEKINLLANNNCESLTISKDRIMTIRESSLPLAKANCFEPSASVNSIEEELVSGCNFDLAIPIRSEQKLLFGAIILGNKKSKTRFTIEDIDLLSTIASRSAASIERIRLQEDLIKEHLETERLEELNELKSLFVSTVSHDLKTPLTSIKLFSEILQNKKDISDDKMKEYLRIIEGESDRLTRLINNVLDFSKIERGIKEYKFEEISINTIVDEVLVMMEYQFKIKKFEIHKSLIINEKLIHGDKDAVAEALINLLSNAIKYSDVNRSITVSTFFRDGNYCLSVEDHGIGIKDSELNNIIDPFFRSNDELTKNESGTGLGLSIVKHIMDAHNGKINVESTWQKGSIFTLIFQTGGENEKNINN